MKTRHSKQKRHQNEVTNDDDPGVFQSLVQLLGSRFCGMFLFLLDVGCLWASGLLAL